MKPGYSGDEQRSRGPSCWPAEGAVGHRVVRTDSCSGLVGVLLHHVTGVWPSVDAL